MEDKVIICIGTVGRPTFKKCYGIIDKFFKNHKNVKKIEIIRNKMPRSEWLNRMAELSVDYDWCLQVDEDMYLYPDALDKLLNFAIDNKKNGVKICNASCMLKDLFLNEKIGSLKIWNTDVFKYVKFKNVLGSDREFFKDALNFGFKNISIDNILADHDSAPTPEIAYKKYYEYIKKINNFNGYDSAKNFINTLEKINIKKNNNITKMALKGAINGLNEFERKINNKKISVLITSYNRFENLLNILNNIKSKNYEIDVIIYDDASKDLNINLNNLKSKNYNLFFIKSEINNGKKNYYKNINILLDYVKKDFFNKKNYFLTILLQDDLEITKDFVDICVDRWFAINKNIKNPVITYHTDILRKYHSCWNSGDPKLGDFYDITNWADCLFYTSPENFHKINFNLNGKYSSKNNGKMSSGVGKEFTDLFREKMVPLLRLNDSLANNKKDKSKMNKRIYNIETFNYIENINKKIRISIASMNERFENLKETINSLNNQFDILNIYLNNYSENNINYLVSKYKDVNFFSSQEIYNDLGDTGKFLFQNKKDYYLTCDDDIIYPSNYSKRIIDGIEKYNCIVGFHGSIISNDEDYYKRKNKIHFSQELNVCKSVNILGTGVMGFDNSKYIFPFNILITKNMSDIYIAEYANNNSFNLMCLSKEKNWIIPQNVENNIYDSSKNKDGTSLDNSNYINKIIKRTKWKI